MPLRSVAQPRRGAAVTDQKRPAGASADKTVGGHRNRREGAVTRVRQKVRGGAALDYTALATFAFEPREGRWLLVHNHVSRVPQ